MTDPKETLEAELAAAEADVTRLRTENAALAETFRAEPTNPGRDGLKRAALALSAARDRVDAARAALAVFAETGSPHGLVARDGQVLGSVAVDIPLGATREQRTRAIDAALGEQLTEVARGLGVVLAAAAANFTRERAGRGPDGKTVLDVAGRVEGDVLTPAVSRAAKMSRR